jgi:hypothetical protein
MNMKKSMISNALAFLAIASSAQAAKYDCKFSNGAAADSHAVTYQFDTAIDNNKFVDLGQGGSVGCVVLRAQPQLLSCGVANGEKSSMFVTTEDGSSLVSLQTNSLGSTANLICVKQR